MKRLMQVRVGQSRPAGFTLTELLVVMGILGVLGTMVLTGVMSARKKAQENETIAKFKLLKAALERYETDFQDYPPSEGDETGMVGAESLYRCLMTEKKEGPYIAVSDFKLVDKNGNGEMEIADSMGAPLLYWHHRDYGNKTPNKRSYRIGSGGLNRKWEDATKESDDLVNWDKFKPDLQ